jgi:pyruvate kinase
MTAAANSATRRARLEELLESLTRIRCEMLRVESDFATELAHTDDSYKESARNLLHYLALRHQDLRPLQEKLASLGLSSLGRSEAHVLATVDSVLGILHELTGGKFMPPSGTEPKAHFAEGARLLEQHTQSLLGPPPADRSVRIMVTLSTEAAEDYGLVRDLVGRGMDCARINTAHDDQATWERMAANVRRARDELNRNCRILMDLAGPKLRTGAIEPGLRVVQWHPRRDGLGRVVANSRIWLNPGATGMTPPAGADACLPVSAVWLSKLRVGDRVEFTDARGSTRSLNVTARTDDGFWTECRQTAYVIRDIPLQVRRGNITLAAMGKIGELPPSEQAIALKTGDTLIVTRAAAPGTPASYDAAGAFIAPATIPCSLPEVFSDVRCGEKIWFDDGKIGGVIKDATPDRLSVLITQARARGGKLRADKGINLPDSNLSLPALTAQDIENLRFIVANAELVGMSFVRRAQDVRCLQSHMERLHGQHMGIVLKIETREGFERLPNLLLALMRQRVGGVMIARGDLAVECGYERLAELQEEILWVCEAAHMPVIWATQVLENLTREGQPSRAEISDAAMGERSECVMLNKGPHVVEAVGVLNDILHRMQAHQSKKTARMRPLHLEAVHWQD